MSWGALKRFSPRALTQATRGSPLEGCLERIGEDDPEEEPIFRDLWDDEKQREVVIESLKADYEVRRGRPPGL
jgi:hypothetical protein